ncbi:MAG: Two-component system sensor histidine kinase [Cytophagales bacterium]|jgi:signal transduction histidine kinase|nr:HAMP domain-containing protein [Bacteroidota bacterium]MBS1982464.1 HAMP domain-containing protein [Bacteroidota bacterium]WHZ06269.1 MAG: Two-component system sensor histidine kinase [Cytophagales bacterium]
MFKELSLKLRITIVFSLIVTFLLGLFAWAIYFFSQATQQNLFFEHLHERAQTTANLILEKNELSSLAFKKAEEIFANGLPEEHIEVYNAANQLVFSEPAHLTKQRTADQLNDIRQKKLVESVTDDYQSLGLLYHDNQGGHVIIIEAPDTAGVQKIISLKYLLLVAMFAGEIITLLIGHLFAKRLVVPFKRIITETREISEHNLSQRLTSKVEAQEITQLVQSFNGLLSRLEQSFQAQKIFIANVSHEIRTPLSIILGELEITMMQKDETALKSQLESFREEVKRLVRLSEQLLWLAQTARDKHDIYFSKVRIDEIIFESVHSIPRIPIENRNVNIEYSKTPLDDSVLLVNGNTDLLHALLINLIENALKYSPANQPIYVSINYTDSEVIVTIKDSGQGIESSEIQKILKPFYRSDKSKTQVAGSGIGLYLCKQILAVHNAQMKIDSKPGEGTTISLYFPQA